MKQYYNKRLAEKNREANPVAFDRMRCGFIENELRSTQDENGSPLYPTENTEIAILRKQISAILEALKANGINAEITEFALWNQTAEEVKESIKQMLS